GERPRGAHGQDSSARTARWITQILRTGCCVIRDDQVSEPYGMRRTFQDLARGAGLREEGQKKICGHITDEMKERYSSDAQGEQREGIGKVVALMTGRPANQQSGAPGGAPTPAGGAPERRVG